MKKPFGRPRLVEFRRLLYHLLELLLKVLRRVRFLDELLELLEILLVHGLHGGGAEQLELQFNLAVHR